VGAAKTTKTTSSKADWSLRPRGAASATAQGALALAAVAVLGEATALSPLWGAAATVAGGLGSVLVSAHRAHPPVALLYRLCCWLGAGSWLTYTLATTLWSQGAWAALGIGALTAGVTAPLGRARKNKTGHQVGRALVLGRTAKIGAEWEARIRRVCRVAATVSDVRPWDNGAGYDVHLTLPPGGVTRRDLAARAEALATDADLPEGCSVEARPVDGHGRAHVVLRVATVNRLGQIIGFPAAYQPRSILQPLVIGEHSNSDPCGATVREEAALIAGKRGSGKTTLLQDISIELGLCSDNIVWHLDLNGGGLTQPWIDVWLDGRAARCPIDWAAANPDEGKLMLKAAIAIAKHRKASYRKLKRAHNTNLLPVSADLPQITIVVDEGANAVKDRELGELIGDLQNMGRNEAVNLIISSLRPTGDLVPVNMRKQSGVRIQMFGPDDEELGHMFGWTAGGKLTMDQLAGKGTGFISVDGAAPRPFRAYNVLPAQVEEAALAVSTIRPDLDAASAQAAGTHYTTRYQRMRAVFTELADGDSTEELRGAEAALPATRVPAPPPATRSHLASVPCGPDAAAWPDLRAMTRTPAPAIAAYAADWPDLRDLAARNAPLRAEQIHPAQAAGAGHGLAVAVQPVPQILTRALAVFDQMRSERLHSGELAAALGIVVVDEDGMRRPDTTALAGLLRPLGVERPAEGFLRGGRRGRGYERGHLEAAAERIRRGEIEVPAEVASWPAA
jgi:hypothetical protein